MPPQRSENTMSTFLSCYSHDSTTPILFLEPSCWSMFVEDYRELKIDNAETVAKRCFLFEKFVDDLLAQEPEALQFKNVRLQCCHSSRIVTPSRF